MTDKLVSDQEMEMVGSLLPRMTASQLYLVKNKIDQILFEAMLEGKRDFTVKFEVDANEPLGVKIELPKGLQDLMANATAEVQAAMAELQRVTSEADDGSTKDAGRKS
jgi:hypothetical protein